MTSPIAPYLNAFLTILFWAAAFPAIRLGLREIEAIPLAAMRFAIASVLAIAWLAWKQPQRPSLADLARFALSGAIGISLYNICLNLGQQTVSAGAASFIVNMQGVITAFLAMVFLGESFRGWAWFGTVLCLAGVALIASNQPGGLQFGAGASLVLGAAFCSGVTFVIQRPLVARYGPITSAAINVLMGALFLTPWLAAGATQSLAASATALSSVVFLGVLPGAVGYMTWMATLSAFGAARAANVLYLVPPVAIAIAYLIADEAPGWMTLVGGFVTLSGVILVNTKGRAQKAS
jgi:drug/metabolite transporter (DMT)-like permease